MLSETLRRSAEADGWDHRLPTEEGWCSGRNRFDTWMGRLVCAARPTRCRDLFNWWRGVRQGTNGGQQSLWRRRWRAECAPTLGAVAFARRASDGRSTQRARWRTGGSNVPAAAAAECLGCSVGGGSAPVVRQRRWNVAGSSATGAGGNGGRERRETQQQQQEEQRQEQQRRQQQP